MLSLASRSSDAGSSPFRDIVLCSWALLWPPSQYLSPARCINGYWSGAVPATLVPVSNLAPADPEGCENTHGCFMLLKPEISSRLSKIFCSIKYITTVFVDTFPRVFCFPRDRVSTKTVVSVDINWMCRQSLSKHITTACSKRFAEIKLSGLGYTQKS